MSKTLKIFISVFIYKYTTRAVDMFLNCLNTYISGAAGERRKELKIGIRIIVLSRTTGLSIA